MKNKKEKLFVDNIDFSIPPRSINQFEREPAVSVNQIEDTVKFLVGRICTIIDASYSDKEQAKAIKELVKNDLYGASSKIKNWVWEMDDNGDKNKFIEFPFWSSNSTDHI